MPGFNLDRAFRVAGGARLFLRAEGGLTRGPTPAENEKKRARQLKAAWKKIQGQRRTVEQKDAEISRLEKELRAAKTGSEGALPDFLIIGAQKAGTTSLYFLLKSHPLFRAPVRKEIHFFDSRKFINKGVEWYCSQFPTSQEKERGRTITGEASPYYLFHPLAAQRTAQVMPDAKLVMLLRNPVERAYSDYQHTLRQGNEHLSFEEAVEVEEERIAGEREKIISDRNYVSRPLRRYSYLSRGIYVDQIREWHKYFPPEQLLILKSEEFFRDPAEITKRIQRFLGLPVVEPEIPEKKRNVGTYDPINPDTRRRLEEFFAPHNRRLYEYLGVDFGW